MTKIRSTVSAAAAALLSGTIALGAVAPAEADGLLQEIKDRGKFVVATEAAFEPFEFVKDGEIVGYGKDLLDLVVADLGVELEQLDLPWQGILPGLLANKYDIVATSVAINEERAKKYAYTMPIASFGNGILVRADNDEIKGADDLDGKIVATQLASSVEPVLRKFDEELRAKGGGLKEMKLFQAFPETTVAVASGQADAAIQATPNLAVLMAKRPGEFKIVGTVGEDSWLCWVTRPADLDVRDFLNERFLALRDSGKMAELQQKWFGFTMETPTEGYLPAGAF